jgi:hypothetical protein
LSDKTTLKNADAARLAECIVWPSHKVEQNKNRNNRLAKRGRQETATREDPCGSMGKNSFEKQRETERNIELKEIPLLIG